jgi:hypothetical protein
VANVGAGVPAVQHADAGDCVQRVSGVFPDAAAGGGLCVDVDRKQDRDAGRVSEFHGLFAAWKPRNRDRFSRPARAGRLEIRISRGGGSIDRRNAGDEAVNAGNSPDLRRRGEHRIRTSTVARAPAAVDHHAADRSGGNLRGVRQTVAALVNRAVVDECTGAWDVAGVFPAYGDGAGDARAHRDLLGGAAAREAFEQRTARGGLGNAVVVAGERAVWILCEAHAGERGVWRFGGGDRFAGVDADFSDHCFLRSGVECGVRSGQEQRKLKRDQGSTDVFRAKKSLTWIVGFLFSQRVRYGIQFPIRRLPGFESSVWQNRRPLSL